MEGSKICDFLCYVVFGHSPSCNGTVKRVCHCGCGFLFLLRRESLSVTDNRTQKSYTIPIKNKMIAAKDLLQIKRDEDAFGLRCACLCPCVNF